MTIEQRARELLGDVIGYDLRRSLDTDSMTVTIDDALTAISAALSARASAGEDGVGWPNGSDKTVPAALRYLAEHERPIGGEQRYNSAHLYQLADEVERMASRLLTAAPQPAQAGAGTECEHRRSTWRLDMSSGTCKDCGAGLLPDGSSTPASPATEDGPDSFDCPHAHAARVCGCGFCRALNSDRYAFGAPQPAAAQGGGDAAAKSAAQFLLAKYDGAECDARAVSDCIRCNVIYLAKQALAAAPQPQTPVLVFDNVTPSVRDDGALVLTPAHGDGEVLGFLRKFDADFIARKQHGQCQVIIYQERPRKDAVPLYTATRPTPEAQEARDAARFIVLRDALLGTNTAAMEYFKSNGAPTSVEQFNAYCDAALALPAQGGGL